MAAIYAGIAQNGTIYRPRILLKTKDNNRGAEGALLKKYTLSDETFRFIKDALFGVVHDPGGTGANARVPGALVAGKTGTAQVVSVKMKPKQGQPVPRHLENHAWFVSFSPVEKPEIVVCVFLEHGGGRGQKCSSCGSSGFKSIL